MDLLPTMTEDVWRRRRRTVGHAGEDRGRTARLRPKAGSIRLPSSTEGSSGGARKGDVTPVGALRRQNPAIRQSRRFHEPSGRGHGRDGLPRQIDGTTPTVETSETGSYLVFSGADDGTRTRDPHLGKVMLYQLSHVRVSAEYLTSRPRAGRTTAYACPPCRRATTRMPSKTRMPGRAR
jgi:hypothetical protein